MSNCSGRPLAVKLHHFDPATASAAQWRRLHAYRRLRGAEDAPGEPLPPDTEFETELRDGRTLFQQHRILALHGQEIVGNLVLSFRRPGSPDSQDFARHLDVMGGVALAHRRQGVARALLSGLDEFMRKHDKSLATAKVRHPQAHLFMQAIGAQARQRMVDNRLRLQDVDWVQMRRWSDDFPASAKGLRWELHAGRVPMATLDGLMEPLSQLINQQPLGTLDIPRIRFELQGYRDWYADMDRRGGEHFMVLLRAGSRLAAVCDASWDQRYPERMHQQLTAVAPPWRGQGLAKAVKARMLLLVRERHPQVQLALTFNAQANAPMLSINQRLGYAVHREDAIYQVEHGSIRQYLVSRRAESP